MAISGSDLGKIDFFVAVVLAVGVGNELGPIGFAVLTAQESADFVIRGKDGARRAQLGPHVGDHMPIHRRQAGQPRSVIFQHAADGPVDVVPPQHFQHDVLGAHPVGSAPTNLTPHTRGILT